MSFKYSGKIESSKSIVNRALIIQSLILNSNINLDLDYLSQAEDVLLLESCLNKFLQIKELNHEKYSRLNSHDDKLSEGIKDEDYFDVGSGGTTFRFLAFFLSRHSGVWKIKISKQLSLRPHQDLLDILRQLGVSSEIITISGRSFLLIYSYGWKKFSCDVDLAKSSQFLSGLLLASIGLSEEFEIKCLNRNLSSGYEMITIELLRDLGLEINDNGERITIKGSLQQKRTVLSIGADWSSVISILCFCFSGSNIEITNIDINSKEPDKNGLEILKNLGLDFNYKDEFKTNLKANSSQLKLPTQAINLTNNPDLFPVICVLASQISLKYKSEIVIQYPEQLIYKESDRLNAMVKFLSDLGFKASVETSENSSFLKISSKSNCESLKTKEVFEFQSESDHRLVMSFELLKSFGYNINYNNPECVKKSFSNFFEIVYG